MGYAIIGFGKIGQALAKQGDRVLVAGLARGEIKATNKTWEDDFAPSHAARSWNAQP
jgi:predicted dinucleotide-binding enzyme